MSCHSVKWTKGGSLPSPASVRWWGKVNRAIRTAVNVSLVKANNIGKKRAWVSHSFVPGCFNLMIHKTWLYSFNTSSNGFSKYFNSEKNTAGMRQIYTALILALLFCCCGQLNNKRDINPVFFSLLPVWLTSEKKKQPRCCKLITPKF